MSDALLLRGGVTLDCDVDSAPIQRDHAVSIGLIVNELVTNAAKHAFEGRERGAITVSWKRRREGGWRLTVADDGVGMPPGPKPARKDGGLGQRLIEAFAHQAGGDADHRQRQNRHAGDDGRARLTESAPRRVGAGMQRLWFITNPHSGSSDAAKAEAILATFVERGLTLAGRTDFPDDDVPTPGALAKAKADTVVLFAGDGTINASVCALAEWDGAILVLPGGTMNMLAKSLHGDADPAAISLAAHENERRVALPFVEAGKHRALVGLIVGPAANWYHARERIRERRLGRLVARGRGTAWRRTFGKGIRLAGAPGLPCPSAGCLCPRRRRGLGRHGDRRARFPVGHRPRLELDHRRLGCRSSRDRNPHRSPDHRRAPPGAGAVRRRASELDPAAVIGAGRTREQFIATRAVA